MFDDSQKRVRFCAQIRVGRKMTLILYYQCHSEIPVGHLVPLCKITPNFRSRRQHVAKMGKPSRVDREPLGRTDTCNQQYEWIVAKIRSFATTRQP